MRWMIGLFLALAAMAADDPWTKVKVLKGGSELRIYKKGMSQPVLATFDEANEERMVVVIKSEQVAIAKAEIDRIDSRPPRTGPRFTKESKVTQEVDSKATPSRGPKSGAPTSTSSSTGLTINTRPDFETIYRRGLKN